MFPVEFCGYRKNAYKEHVLRLEEACRWLGINQGRAQHYIGLLREFHEEDKRTPQHVLAYSESCEVEDIYRLWQSKLEHFPGLKRKIFHVLSSGPVLREQERANNNRARNDAFVYFLAGMLLSANVKVVSIDGVLARETTGPEDADITLLCDGEFIDVQCKRPQTFHGFDARVKEARRQIISKHLNGVVAVDCSAIVQRESLNTYQLFKNRNSNNPDLFWSTFQQLKNVLTSA